MKFLDQAKIFVKAGDGGNGCVAFRREKYIEGMSDACRALDFPVVSGNVSFYNETENSNIPPLT